VTDASGDEPDLLAQATAAQPIAHSPRSSRHRRRRRRGPNWPLIIGIAVVVLVVGAAAVVLIAHKSSSTKGSPGAAAPSWSHANLDGKIVTIHSGTGADAFLTESNGMPVPRVVYNLDKVASQGCVGLRLLTYYQEAYAKQPNRADHDAVSAYAAYGLTLIKHKKCQPIPPA